MWIKSEVMLWIMRLDRCLKADLNLHPHLIVKYVKLLLSGHKSLSEPEARLLIRFICWLSFKWRAILWVRLFVIQKYVYKNKNKSLILGS